MKYIDAETMTELTPRRPLMVELFMDGAGSQMSYDERDEQAVLQWLTDLKSYVAVKALREAGREAEPRSFKGKIPAGRCAYCLQMSDNLQRDHIVPVSKGGTDDPDNIVSACPSCNSKKKDSSLLQFVARGGVT